MNQWLKISVPIGLGLAAAIANFMAMSGVLETEDYVVLANNVSAGEKLSISDLQVVTLNKQYLPEAAVRARDQIVFDGVPVIRQLVAGQVLLSTDVRSPRVFKPIPADMWAVTFSPIRYGQPIEMFQVGGDVRVIIEEENGEHVEIGPFPIYAVGANRSPIPMPTTDHPTTITVLGKKSDASLITLMNATTSQSSGVIVKQVIPAN